MLSARRSLETRCRLATSCPGSLAIGLSASFGRAARTIGATHHEGVPVRCSLAQNLRQPHVRRVPLVAVVGC
jgi:hypothetical protein